MRIRYGSPVPDLSASDGVRLFAHDWEHAAPRGIVAILHGYAEHGARYTHVAETFNAHGFSVYTVDLRGHGCSEGSRGHIHRFSEYHHDVDAVVTRARARGGRAPLFVLGHSMGGLLACHYWLHRRDTRWSGALLSSPYLGLALPVTGVKGAAGRLLSRLAPKVSIPSEIPPQTLSRDPEMVKAYIDDPLVFTTANTRWFTEALSAIDEVQARARELEGPMLLLYGGADGLASPQATRRFAVRLIMPDIEVERLPDLRHEILNELPADRERIKARMVRWMEARLGAP